MERFSREDGVVVLALGSVTENDLAVIDGVREVLNARRGWNLVVLPEGYEAPLRTLAEAGQLLGAIGDFVSSAWMDSLASQAGCWVQIAQISHLEGRVNVAPDYADMARRAVASLRANGCAALGFVGLPGQFASAQMETAFVAAAAAGGMTARTARAVSTVNLREFLRGFAPPVGLFAATDRLARQTLEAAAALDWRCPEDLAIIGTGNDRLESLRAPVAISSFELPGRDLGRRAAETLVRLREGADEPARLIAIPAGVLHERASSRRRGSAVDRALAFARSRLGEALPVGELARVAGMSRRSFEQAMQREQGMSPATWIRELRRERAEQLLRTSTLAVQAIGERCGYVDLPAFSKAFKTWTGLSPQQFRAQAAGAEEPRSRRARE